MSDAGVGRTPASRPARGSAPRPLAWVHPAVVAFWFAGAFAAVMTFLQPALAVAAWAGAWALSVVARGAAATGRDLLWQPAVAALLAAANCALNPQGTTVLFSAFGRPFCLEPLAFGLVSGLSLSAVLALGMDFSALLGPSSIQHLLGNRFPNTALALSQGLGLVPALVRRARSLRESCCATSAAGRRAAPSLAQTSTWLLAWALDDSLARADSMRARGWGAVPRRTHYGARPFNGRDALALALCFGLAAAGCLGAAALCASWRFYPSMPALETGWGLLAFAAYFFAPVAAAVADELRWTWLENKR